VSRSVDRWPQRVFYVAAAFIFAAVYVRVLLLYPDRPELGPGRFLLLVWLALFVGEALLSHRFPDRVPGFFPFYLLLQSLLFFLLLDLCRSADFLVSLLSILSMQAMSRLNPRTGMLWLFLCTVILAPVLVREYQTQAIALVLIYTAANLFLGAYALALRRAQGAYIENQAVAHRLREETQKLQVYAAQLEGLAAVRERNRLARDLHDSVTQTVFSMNLTAQSALLLLHRDPAQARPHLERLRHLAQSALSEMELLIVGLRPEKAEAIGLASVLDRHLVGNRLLEGLSISLETEGDADLSPAEEQSLFRITQEALNNVVKHARVSRAEVRLHLIEPYWLEIEDRGQGFDLRRVQRSDQVGLNSMHERAAEIGWALQIITAPGAGTRIRVEKPQIGEGRQ
jgi:signal transduction histidine kinase